MWGWLLLIILVIAVASCIRGSGKKSVHFATDNLEMLFRKKDPPTYVGKITVVPMATRDAHGANMD